MRTTHAPCVVKHHKGASGLKIVRVDIQEVAIGVLKTEAVIVFVVDGINKRPDGNLILGAGRT
jgi:hypothetical protein